MNYEDEDYVRYYTRETVGWKALGWEGQTVLSLMLHGKFDRSGVFDCDGHDPSHAVTLVTGAPIEVTAVGLKRLTDCGAWVIVGGRIVWPKYVHAQNCRRTDKARQRESRDKRRGDALGENVTNVTFSHTESQPVTPSRAEQSRAEDPPKPPRGQRRKRAKLPEIPIPEPFVPTSRHAAYCALHALNLQLELDAFLGWAEGKTAASWNGTFSTRLANAVKFREERGSGTFATARRVPPAAPLDASAKEAMRQREAELEARARAQNRAALGQMGGHS